MNLKEHLFSLGLGSFLCFLICVLVIFNFDPEDNSLLPVVFFYLSLFLGLIGGFTFFAILIKKGKINNKDNNEEIIFRQIKKIFRQAIVFASLILLLLFLAHEGFLNWFVFLLVLFFYFIYEGIIFSEKNSKDSFYV